MPAQEPRRTALINPESDPQPVKSGFTQTILALGGVLLLIWGLAWMYRKAARATGGLSTSLGAGGRAPAGIVEILARYPLASRHTLVVLRFDRRVLLCSMTGGGRSSSAGMSVLCELEDPEDVASILIKSRDEAGESLARSFERSLRESERTTDAVVRSSATARAARPPARTAAPASGPSALRRGLESMRAGGRR
jgi:flagellar biogenesis protein FliO